MEKKTLKGKTLFITGSSRGIGKAIALRAARDGANIVITGKTSSPHPKLSGTIYTAAKEVEEAGGVALAVEMDVRFDDQVERALHLCVKTFGGLDILVNNASAISLTKVDETPLKLVDLMWDVNMRGTYLCSQLAQVYLKASSNPHILTLSPPLSLNPDWFAKHTAYTISKFGMSMCVMGMAEEFRADKIKVNALWPATLIHTAALKILGAPDLAQRSRRPEIVADAAYEIFLKDDPSYTGKFFIDEEVLKERGVSDFSVYNTDPLKTPMKDLFLD